MSKIKRIPFDAEKAKKGAKIVTRCGYPVRIGFYDIKGRLFTIAGAVTEEDNTEVIRSFTKEGRHYALDVDSDYDLFIEEEEQEKTRREYSGTDSIFVPKDDKGIIEELIDAINGLWNNDALPMPLFLKRKDAWITWLQKQGQKNTADEVEKEIKTRRMTQQEFSWWLRDCPGEHREYMVKGGHTAYTADYNYPIDEADEEIGEVYIRRNGGEWEEPLINIK